MRRGPRIAGVPLAPFVSGCRIALVSLVVLLAAGCGREKPPAPLRAADPSVEPVALEWNTIRELATPDEAPEGLEVHVEREDGRVRYWVTGLHWRLELRPDHRFRYAWRPAGDAQAPWQALEGRWRASDGDWQLRPDAGRAALDPDGFAPGDWPRVRWTPSATGGGPDTPGVGAVYLVPALDSATRRLRDGYLLVPDPRAGAHVAAGGR